MEISYLLGRIQSKQEFVALTLASYRNRMVRMHVHLGITGLSLGLSTAVAGLFGMNVVNGFESSPTAFSSVVLGSGFGGIIISAGCLSFLSGRGMLKRAEQRLEEMESLTEALPDMTALDHALKSTIEKGQPIDKSQFRNVLRRARNSNQASQRRSICCLAYLILLKMVTSVLKILRLLMPMSGSKGQSSYKSKYTKILCFPQRLQKCSTN
jgi:hypothetical protein